MGELCERRLPAGKERISSAKIAAVLVAAWFCEPSSELHIAQDWYRRTALCDLLQLAKIDIRSRSNCINSNPPTLRSRSIQTANSKIDIVTQSQISVRQPASPSASSRCVSTIDPGHQDQPGSGGPSVSVAEPVARDSNADSPNIGGARRSPDQSAELLQAKRAGIAPRPTASPVQHPRTAPSRPDCLCPGLSPAALSRARPRPDQARRRRLSLLPDPPRTRRNRRSLLHHQDAHHPFSPPYADQIFAILVKTELVRDEGLAVGGRSTFSARRLGPRGPRAFADPPHMMV